MRSSSITALSSSSRRRAVFYRLQKQWAAAMDSCQDAIPMAAGLFPHHFSTMNNDDATTREIRYSRSSSPIIMRQSSSSLAFSTWTRYFSTHPSMSIDGGDDKTAPPRPPSKSTNSGATTLGTTDIGKATIDLESVVSGESSESTAPPNRSSSGNKNAAKKKRTYDHRRANHRRRLVSSQMKRIKVLQIEPHLHDQSIIEQDFENLALDTSLMKIKWMERLYKELQKEHKKMRQGKAATTTRSAETNPQRRLWRKVLELFTKQKIPKEMKDVFLQRLVVNVNNKKEQEAETPAVSEPQQQQIEHDISLLQQTRSIAAQYPMFWSRDWKRKLRKALKKRKVAATMLEDAAAAVAAAKENEYSASSTATTSTTETYSTMIRSPALQTAQENLTDEQQHEHAAALQAKLQSRLSPQQYRNMMQYFQDYVDNCDMNPSLAEEAGDVESDDDDEEEHEECHESEDSLAEVNEDTNVKNAVEAAVLFPDVAEPISHDDDDDDANPQGPVKAKQQQLHTQQELRILKSNLQRFIPENRFHLVAPDVSDFLYLTTSDDILDNTLGANQLQDAVYGDRIVRTHQKRWDAAKELYTKCFQQIHKMLLKVQEEEVPTIFKGVNDSNADLVMEESVLETIAAVAATKSKGKPAVASTERVRPRKYIAFEAMEIIQPTRTENDDEATAGKYKLPSTIDLSSDSQVQIFENEAFSSTAPTDRMVFIDNLPIDINRERLLKAYGRVGEIEAFELFHHRPELDPGRKAIDDRKKIRNPSSSSRRQRWLRPRTPLYGMLLYKEPEAAAKAVADPLRIFGMVLDKHLIRSHRATDMTKLYLEDVNPAHDITAIEYDLSRILHPDLYVCLDVSAHRRRQRPRGKPEPLSCAIQLPSFEATYWAYQKLHLELEYLQDKDGACSLHWMETPADAMLYWTRELNF